MIHQTILGTVGCTPVVRLRRLATDNGTEILVKLEAFNPAGSIKDRTALFMIAEAERSGRLKPHGTIIESTSGNLGKSLALIGAVKSYRVILVVDPKTPRSIINFVSALGADIEMVNTPDERGSYQRPRVERVKQLLTTLPDAFWPDQYDNPDNRRAHAEGTAHELISDVPHFDTLVAAVSTGGHLCGLAATLKTLLPNLTTIGVDAAGSAAFGFPFTGYAMRGLGLSWRPGNLVDRLVDRVQLVADHEGIATSRLLARVEGLLVGESAGAAVFGALHYAHHHPSSRIVVVAADNGENYIDESFDDGWLRDRGLAERIASAGLTEADRLVAAAANPTYPTVTLEHTCAMI